MSPPSSGVLSLPEVFTPTPRPDPIPAPPATVSLPSVPTTTWSNAFDQYRYGEVRDSKGNLIQSGPTSNGSSFDQRYTEQQQGRPLTVIEEIIGPPAGTEVVCIKETPTAPQKCKVVPKREAAQKRPDPTPSVPLNIGPSPYSEGIPSLFSSPILQQYLQKQPSRTPVKKKSSSIIAPLVVGAAVVVVGIFLLTRK